jgi:2-methylaconitate cis-trans-isomerase PrpF
MGQAKISCVIMRGGTSKGVFFREADLPPSPERRERVILAVFGSPDVRQIDGLGGADPLTSKAAIIGPPSRPDADVDYTFGYVGITQASVDWKGNCGNISSAVGPYAVDEGIVRPADPITTVRIYNTNTKKLLIAEVPTRGGRFQPEGDYAIAGVPGTGAKIRVDFRETAGSVTGRLLPTGRPTDTLTLDGGRALTVSFVDCSNPFVFVRAADLGLTNTESVDEWIAHPTALVEMERIRCLAAEVLGIARDRRTASADSPGVPKVALVAPPRPFTALSGAPVAAGDVHLLVRMTSLQKPHKAFATTGGVCLAVASRIPGTVVHEAVPPAVRGADTLQIGHPSGVMPVDVLVERGEAGFAVRRAALGRTARRLMDGTAYIPADLLAR